MDFKQDELKFWLPSDVLADEDTTSMEESLFRCFSDSVSSRFLLPTELAKPLTNGSALSSPGKSVVGSSETESDEDVYLLSELTRQLALLDGHKKNYVHSGSPQSTLFHVESFSGRSIGSSNGSPNGPSQVSSPPTTPLASNNSSWDLIYKAAGLVENLKSSTAGAGGLTASNSGAIFQRQGSFSQFPPPNSSNHSSVYTNYHLQGEELPGRQVINGPKIGGLTVNSGGWRPPYVYGGYSNPQFGNKNHHLPLGPVARVSCGVHLGHGYGYGTGNRVPVGAGVVKSERVGTGVFLPRRYDGKTNGNSHCNGVDTRKKSGNSSINSNKKVPIINKSFNNNGKDALMVRKMPVSVPVSVSTIQRKTTPFPDGPIHHEICLPQEWTY